jgi:glycosyltransferase involved in cell wall biosynthesis
MPNPGTLVSIGLPVRNAGSRVAGVVRSVLAQDHENLELVISDNASTDDTEQVCRELATGDSRIVYYRQPRNVGMLNNFIHVIGAAKGTYFRWIGDDDRLEPSFASRCLDVFEADPRLILVTSAIGYTGTRNVPYTGTALASDDPVDRFAEMLHLLNAQQMFIDPLYAMMRRETAAAIPRRNMLREDEVFATKLALAGPWRHIPEVLAHRVWKSERIGTVARRLGVPAWHARFSNTLAYREILAWLPQANLTDGQLRRARAAVYRSYLERQWRIAKRRSGKLVQMATSR